MMEAVTKVEGKPYPWGAKNIDTDIIISAHWLKTISREGLGRGAFEAIRQGPDNIFGDPTYAGSPILIAPSYSDIFSGNAFKNRIVAVVLPQATIDRLIEVAKTDTVTTDLETMTVTTPYQDRFAFEMNSFRRDCLMQGLDEIGLMLARDTAISKYESMVAVEQPWIGKERADAGVTFESAGRT